MDFFKSYFQRNFNAKYLEIKIHRHFQSSVLKFSFKVGNGNALPSKHMMSWQYDNFMTMLQGYNDNITKTRWKYNDDMTRGGLPRNEWQHDEIMMTTWLWMTMLITLTWQHGENDEMTIMWRL